MKKISVMLTCALLSLMLSGCSASDCAALLQQTAEAVSNLAAQNDMDMDGAEAGSDDTSAQDAEKVTDSDSDEASAEGSNGTSGEDTAGDADSAAEKASNEVEGSNDASTAPVVYEDFEGDTNLALERGEVTFTISNDGSEGTKALLISDRTDTWNGANFDCNVFRGNKIIASALIKSAAKTVRITIQYDMNGAPVYNWITSTAGNADNYVALTGRFTIPEDVENIYVYVESDSCDDMLVDNLKVEADGQYKEPGELVKPEMADTSECASLKDVFADSFDIGVCINPITVMNEDYSSLIKAQFSSATCENELKPDAVINREETIKDTANDGEHLVLNMDGAVDLLDFARDNGMKMRGHTLIWHSQTPDWIFYRDYDVKGELADRELMLTRVDNYMHDMFTWADENYPNLFYAWDVVNEAVEDNGKMRDSLWYQTIGDDYIEQVFAIARKYAPDYIKLFYNDYNSFQTSKQAGIIEMLKPVADAGNIDGIGMQGHLYTGEDPAHFAKCAEKYAEELGVIIHVTEIDVTQPSGINPENDQGKYYGALFKALKDAKANGVPIESVTVWGLTDALSWKSSEKPLLFNADLSAKLAFYEAVQAGYVY